jgi:A/G-specific adenine glycosylase
VNDTDILPLVKKALYRKSPCTWYNALMDLGSDLKTTTENPNRRSRHYTKQAAFEGSDRKIRGSIIRILLTHKRLTRKAVIQQFTEEEERVARILSNLEAEGFIACSGAWVSIAPR